MYRPPVNPGYDTIGAAIADGLQRATGALRGYRMEDREEARYQEAQARQRRMDEIAEEERRRAREIQDAELGVVDASEATYDPIRAAMIDRSDPAAPRADERPMVGGARQPLQPRVREGVVRMGDRFIDPRRSLGFVRSAALQEAESTRERTERERQIQEGADRLMSLDPKMTRAEAVARAAGLSATSPLTRLQAMAQKREELELADEFARREEARRLRSSLALRREAKREEGATMGRARRQNEAEGYALTAATDALRSGQANPEAGVRVRLRALLGNRLTEGEIQELSARAVMTVRNQGMREVNHARVNAPDEEDALLEEAAPPVRSGRSAPLETPELRESRKEWDALYAQIQQIQDPVHRNRAIRELGSRP